MRKVLPVLVAIGLGALAWNVSGATQPKKKAPAKKTAVKKALRKRSAPRKTASRKTASRKTASKKTASRKTSSSKAPVSAHKRSSTAKRRTASSRRRKPAPRTTWRNRQMQPTPERYKEIQEALVAKGLLQPEEATGLWNEASADALKRFQAGQNLEPTGKISSLSLIALGLGPKHDSQPPAAAPATPQPPGN